ncbi:hypothetical protein ACFX1X_041501 [Malus domestica]
MKVNESLKKEVDELQRVRVGLIDEDKQLKDKKDGLEVARPSLFSPEYLLAFTFKASIGEVVIKVGAQAGVAEGEALDDAVAKSVAVVEGVATE